MQRAHHGGQDALALVRVSIAVAPVAAVTRVVTATAVTDVAVTVSAADVGVAAADVTDVCVTTANIHVPVERALGALADMDDTDHHERPIHEHDAE
jgi:hypothetical protein